MPHVRLHDILSVRRAGRLAFVNQKGENTVAKVRIACVSLVTTEDKQTNLNHFVHYIEDASRNGVNILVFPEYSSTGLSKDASMNRVSAAERMLFEDHAERIPQGETVRLMTEQAAKHRMYLCWTMIERDQFYADRIYNTAVLEGRKK